MKRNHILLIAAVLAVIGIISSMFSADMLDFGHGALNWFAAGEFACGVFAAGTFAIGIFSVGVFSVGIFSFGLFSAGIWTAGVFLYGIHKRRLSMQEKQF